MSGRLQTRAGGALPEVSLVLGSGGARGYAHIGVIEELEARGYRIRSIVGSSMGALVGGVHAMGKLAIYRDWACSLQRLDVLRLLDWTLSGGGFIKGDRIIGVLRELIGEIDIEALPIAYTAIAVDLEAQREVWLSRGPLFDAVRASIAIPTVFRPHRHAGRLLVDGGLLNPLPVAPTLRDLSDLTIAVDVNGARETAAEPALPAPDTADEAHRPYAQRIAAFVEQMVRGGESHAEARDPGAFELLSRAFDLMQQTLTRLRLAAQPPDLLISIPRSACMVHEFHRASELIEIGRRRARAALDEQRAASEPK